MTARLTIDLTALEQNYHWLAGLSAPAECAAAVKADAYGLGLAPVATRLWAAGCRAFFVASVAEAATLRGVLPEAKIYVLSNFLAKDMANLVILGAIPVLSTPEAVAAWKLISSDKNAALMVDTGINRLGIGLDQLAEIEASKLNISLLLSHLASADEPKNPQNRKQLELFNAVRQQYPDVSASFANSAGIVLGPDYHCDMTRPGLALYGGEAGPNGTAVKPVVHVEAQILQCRTLPIGADVGYNALWTAARPTRTATVGIGYADGYGRDFSNRGQGIIDGVLCPVIGRVSMDLTVIDVTDAPPCTVGDWVTLVGGEMTLAKASALSGITPYELLTRLGGRFERRYIS